MEDRDTQDPRFRPRCIRGALRGCPRSRAYWSRMLSGSGPICLAIAQRAAGSSSDARNLISGIRVAHAMPQLLAMNIVLCADHLSTRTDHPEVAALSVCEDLKV